MPSQLPDIDFRARRIVLARADFAYAPKPEPPASDLINQTTWHSIVTLPDDVAVRTSNHHGTTLEQLHDVWGDWVQSVGDVHDTMFGVMLDAGDDFQAATYTGLTGFYRVSVAALRSALELVSIGAWAQVCSKNQEINDWRAGKKSLSFGQACDGLSGAAGSLRVHLRTAVNDNLFDQKTPADEGGFARRLFAGLSNFSHSRPGHADGDLRQSNGPIYVGSVFKHVAWLQFETIGFCFVLAKLARPKLSLPKAALDLLDDPERVKSRVTRAAFQFLCS